MFGNTNINTILALVVVGVVIWYLTAPNNVDNEGEVEMNLVNDNITPELNDRSEMNIEDQVVDIAKPTVIPPTGKDVRGLEKHDAGANLDNAFIGAIPPGTPVDEIDFNRNNVTEYDSSKFLPQEVNDEWFMTDFTTAKYDLNDDKLINTNRYIIGVNTVGQSLKNPSYDIRGTIPNPKYTVSPWNNSTYEPDTNIKPLY